MQSENVQGHLLHLYYFKLSSKLWQTPQYHETNSKAKNIMDLTKEYPFICLSVLEALKLILKFFSKRNSYAFKKS